MTIGEAVRLIREQACETQREMADYLGITQVHLSNVENGRGCLSLKLMREIRCGYGFDPYLLMLLTDSKVNLTRHRLLIDPGAE